MQNLFLKVLFYLTEDIHIDDQDEPTVTETSDAETCLQMNAEGKHGFHWKNIILCNNLIYYSDTTKTCADLGNIQKDSTRCVTSKRRLSEILKLPPTPRRNPKHRNYSMQYTPVLTAGERLEAIQKKEAEKMEIEQTKKRKALERKDIKLKREEAKKARMEERERKKKEQKQKKFNRKTKK